MLSARYKQWFYQLSVVSSVMSTTKVGLGFMSSMSPQDIPLRLKHADLNKSHCKGFNSPMLA